MEGEGRQGGWGVLPRKPGILKDEILSQECSGGWEVSRNSLVFQESVVALFWLLLPLLGALSPGPT